MGLINGTILDGGVIATTGGTSKTLKSDGLQVSGGIRLIDDTVTDYRARPTFLFRTVQPAMQADGTLGKGKREVIVTIPRVNALGKQTFPCVRIRLEDFPEMSAAEITKLSNYASQILSDSDFASFWLTGSQS